MKQCPQQRNVNSKGSHHLKTLRYQTHHIQPHRAYTPLTGLMVLEVVFLVLFFVLWLLLVFFLARWGGCKIMSDLYVINEHQLVSNIALQPSFLDRMSREEKWGPPRVAKPHHLVHRPLFPVPSARALLLLWRLPHIYIYILPSLITIITDLLSPNLSGPEVGRNRSTGFASIQSHGATGGWHGVPWRGFPPERLPCMGKSWEKSWENVVLQWV